MKKFISVFLFAAFLGCGTASAQFVGVESSQSEDVDSLKQVVNALANQVNDADRAALDKKIWKDRAKYFNIGYVNQSLNSKDGNVKYKSNLGVNMTWGKTWYLHKKPILNMIKIGLDWSWMDFNYVKYASLEEKYAFEEGGYDDSYDDIYADEEDFDLDFGCHQLEYGMQIGPSITVNPIHHLKVSTYFRFQPSASIMLLDEEVYYGFVPFFNFGAAVSWKAISVGVEGRWGGTKYHGVSVEEEDGSDYVEDWMEDEELAVSDVVSTFRERMRTKSFRVYLSFRF